MFENIFDGSKVDWEVELNTEDLPYEDGEAVAYITAMVGDDCLELTIRGNGDEDYAVTAEVLVTDVVTDREYWITDRDHGFDEMFVGGFDVFEQQFNDAVYNARCAMIP